MPEVDYGRDLSGVADLSYALHEVEDSREGVAESVARRFQGPVFYDDDYGFDLRRLIGRAGTPESDGDTEARIEEEAMKDERVRDCDATLTRFDNSERLEVHIEIRPYDDGPFDLTLEVTALEVKVLSIE